MGRAPSGKDYRGTPNEELLVKRYTVAGWSIARCAREQEISTKRAREILTAHGVEIRARSRELDPVEVLAVFAAHPTVHYVSKVFHVDTRRITQILDDNGVERSRNRGKPPPGSRFYGRARTGPQRSDQLGGRSDGDKEEGGRWD